MKPYPRYKDSGVEWLGEIPEHWDLVRCKYMLPITTIKSNNNDISQRKIALEHIQSWTGKLIENSNTFNGEGVLFNSGDILFGKLRPYLAKVWLADSSGSAVGDFFVFTPSDKVYSRYGYYTLLSKEYIHVINGSTFGAKMPRASWDFIGNLPLTLPQYYEQKHIANYLDHKTHQIDTLIAKKQRLIELLKEERTAVINEAVTKGIDPDASMKDSGIEWLGEIPEDWETKRFKHSLKKIGSGVTPRGGADVYQETGIPLLRSQNIHFDGLHLNDVAYISEEIFNNMLNSEVVEGDVLLNITGASIGRCYYVDGALGKANVNQHVCILRPNNQIETKYLYLILSSHIGQIQVFNKQVGANREGLNFEQLKNFIYPNPPKSERSLIIEYIEKETTRIDTIITKTTKEIDLLQEFRTALISEVVTGKIDVRDWEQPQNDRQTH